MPHMINNIISKSSWRDYSYLNRQSIFGNISKDEEIKQMLESIYDYLLRIQVLLDFILTR